MQGEKKGGINISACYKKFRRKYRGNRIQRKLIFL
jgi:hypothetical protein